MGDRSHYSRGDHRNSSGDHHGGRGREREREGRERSRYSSSTSSYDHDHGRGDSNYRHRDRTHSRHREREREHRDRDRSYRQQEHEEELMYTRRPNHSPSNSYGDWKPPPTTKHQSRSRHHSSTHRERDRHKRHRSSSGSSSSRDRERERAWERDDSEGHEVIPNAPRSPSPEQFTRRDFDEDQDVEFTRRTGIPPDLLRLMERLRGYIPYLKKSLRDIYEQGREKEFSKLVGDIRWALGLITDDNAETLGLGTMKSVYDCIMEVIRKNPINQGYAPSIQYNDDNVDDEEFAEDGDEPPRSPSPPPPQNSATRTQYQPPVLANPRVIPMEREREKSSSSTGASWNYKVPEPSRVYDYSHGHIEKRSSRDHSFDEREPSSSTSTGHRDRERERQIIRQTPEEPDEDWAAQYRRPAKTQPQPTPTPPPPRPRTPEPETRTEPPRVVERVERSFRDMDMRFPTSQWDSVGQPSSAFGLRDRDMRIPNGGLEANANMHPFGGSINSTRIPSSTPRGLDVTAMGLSDMNSPGNIFTNQSITSNMSALNSMPMGGMNQMNSPSPVLPLPHGIQTGMNFGLPFPSLNPGQGLLGQAPGFPGPMGNGFVQFNHGMPPNRGMVPAPPMVPIMNPPHVLHSNTMNPSLPNYHHSQLASQAISQIQNIQLQGFTERINPNPTFNSQSQNQQEEFQVSHRKTEERDLLSQIKEKASFHFGTRVRTPQSMSSPTPVPPPQPVAKIAEVASSTPETASPPPPILASNQILADPRLKGRFAKGVYGHQTSRSSESQSSVGTTQRRSVTDTTSTPSITKTVPNATDPVSVSSERVMTDSVNKNPHISSSKHKTHVSSGKETENSKTSRDKDKDKSKSDTQPLKPPISKVQELRQSIQLHPLGQKPGSKKRGLSFEDALVLPPIEVPEKKASAKNSHKTQYKAVTDKDSGKTQSKSRSSQSSKDKVNESHESNDNHTKRSRKSSSESQRKSSHESGKSHSSSKTAEKEKDGERRRYRILSSNDSEAKSKTATTAKSNEDSTDPMRRPPKSTGFRIPKIKRPDPPPEEPQPVPIDPPQSNKDRDRDEHIQIQTESETQPLDISVEESDNVSSAQSSTQGGVGAQSSEGARTSADPSETDALIRDLILRSVPEGEAEKISGDSSYMADLITRLKTELTSKLKERHTEVPTSSSNTNDTSEKVESATPERDESPSVPERGSTRKGRPRANRKNVKKGHKRRSSLEKLHDALREMNFDTMLPLGPRRGSSKAAQQESQEPPQSLETIEDTKEKDDKNDSSKEDEEEDKEKATEVVTPEKPVKKRGRKRKSTGFVVSPKKKGRKSNSSPAPGASTANSSEETSPSKGKKRGPAAKNVKKADKVKDEESNEGMVTRRRSPRKANPAAVSAENGKANDKPVQKVEQDSADSEKDNTEKVDDNPHSVGGNSMDATLNNNLDMETCDLDNVNSFFGLKLDEIPIDDDFEGKELLDDFDGNKDLLEEFDANKDLLGGLDGNKELMDEFDLAKTPESFEISERVRDAQAIVDQAIADDETIERASNAENRPTDTENDERLQNMKIEPNVGVDQADTDKKVKPRVIRKAKKRGKIQTKPLPGNVHQCHLCSFKGKNIVRHHGNQHLDETNPYSYIPQKSFDKLLEYNTSDSPDLMEVRLRSEGAERDWKCLFCKDKFGTPLEFFEHSTSHTGEFFYGCPICNIRNPFARNIVNHFKVHKTQVGDYKLPTILYESDVLEGKDYMYVFLCRECRYLQITANAIAQHLMLEGHQPDKVVCIKLRFIHDDIKPNPPNQFDRSVFLGESVPPVDSKPSRVEINWEESLALDDSGVTREGLPEEKLNGLYNMYVNNEDGQSDEQDMDRVNTTETPEQINNDVEDTMGWVLSTVEFRTTEKSSAAEDEESVIKPLTNELPSTSIASLKVEASGTETQTSQQDPTDQTSEENVVDTKSAEEEEELNDFYFDDVDFTLEDIVGHSYTEEDDNDEMETPPVPVSTEIEPDSKSPLSPSDSNELEISDEKYTEETEETGMEGEMEDDERVCHPINLSGDNLYRCGNPTCVFQGETYYEFKFHTYNCGLIDDPKQIPCFHCDKLAKSIPTLLEHIKVHGKRRQICGLCSYRCWQSTELAKHMRITHKANNYKVIKFISDNEHESFMYPKDVASKLAQPSALKANHMLYAPKVQFHPHEIENISKNSIFTSLVHCALCSYSTKVRSNILRHLQLHERSDSDGGATEVPSGAPVNPVPWLERKELMFDKMTNWAGSSHTNKDGTVAKEEASKLPQFVLDQFRYVCSVQNCKQITVDDSLLRTHMKTLHSEVDVYDCPHCYDNENTRNDPRNSLPIDKLGSHLKLHGPRLLKCGHCDHIHTQTRLMEKHVSEKHPEKKPIHYLLRNLDNEGNVTNRRASVDENLKGGTDRWRCGICRAIFGTWEEAKVHCKEFHKVGGQFMCTSCNLTEDNLFRISTHMEEHGTDDSGTHTSAVMIMFAKSELNNVAETKQDDNMSHFIWRREDGKVRHIRGIYLEEHKEPEVPGPSSAPTTSTKITKPQVSTIKTAPKSESLTKLVCPECREYKTDSPENMVIHLYHEFHYYRYSCKRCSAPYVTMESLIAHVMNDHDEPYNEHEHLMIESINKEIENFVTELVQDMKEKRGSGKRTSTEVDPELPCKHCGAVLYGYHNLMSHITTKHPARRERFRCVKCKNGFWSEQLLRDHFAKLHPEEAFEMEPDYRTTPEYWMREYGIPKECVNSMSNDGAKSVQKQTRVVKAVPNLKPKQRRMNTVNGGDKSDKSPDNLKEKQSYVYRCKHCVQIFFTIRGIRNHWMRCHKNYSLTLPCQYMEFKSAKATMESPQGVMMTCVHCLYSTPTVARMKAHYDWKHPDQPFRIKRKVEPMKPVGRPVDTDRTLRTKTLMTAESKGSQNEPAEEDYVLIEDNILYMCTLCRKEFNSELDFDTHARHQHTTVVEPQIKYARRQRSPRIPHGLGKDVKEVGNLPEVRQTTVTVTTSIYLCPVCSFTTAVKEEITDAHLRNHIKTFKCQFCSRYFMKGNDVRFHIRHFHGFPLEMPTVCNMLVEHANLARRVKVKTISTVQQLPKQQVVGPRSLKVPHGSIPVYDIVDDEDEIPVVTTPRTFSKATTKKFNQKQTARKSTSKPAMVEDLITYENDRDNDDDDDEVQVIETDANSAASKSAAAAAIFARGYSIEYDDASDFDETYEDPATYLPGPSTKINSIRSYPNLVG